MNVLVPAQLDAAQRTALMALLARRGEADGHPALPEPLRAAVAGDAHGAVPTTVLAYEGSTLIGSALVSPDHDGSVSVHLVVDPAAADQSAVHEALLSRRRWPGWERPSPSPVGHAGRPRR